MKLKIFKKILPVVMLIMAPVIVEAATATATVTANIVPMTSLGITSSAIFSGLSVNRENNGIASLRTSGSGSAAKLKVQSSQNLVYGISVTQPVGFKDEYNAAHSLRMLDSDFTVSEGGLTEKGERELEFGGVIRMMGKTKSGSIYGSVNITTNYN